MPKRFEILIICGLICSGFSFNFDVDLNRLKFLMPPVLYAVAAVFMIVLNRLKVEFPDWVEKLLLITAILIAFYGSRYLETNRLIFVSNGLIV